MPPVVAAITPYIVGAVTAIGGGTFAALGVGLAVGAAFTYSANAFLLNKALSILNKRGKTGETRGMEVSIADTNAEARVIYGEVRVGGVHMIPGLTSGTSNEKLHNVLAIAAHEIDSFQAYYLDQDVSPTPASITGASGDGLVSTGTYANKLWLRGYTGTMTQTVDYILNAAFPSQWASTARARGFAYVAATFDYADGKVYKSIPAITVKVRGAKVYDPRLDSTNGGSGSQRYTDTTTWTYSNNPALCWANYRIASYGYGNDPATEIDWTTVAAAADVCDALVANKDGGTSKRYTCNGLLINDPDNLLDNEQKLIDSMLGHRTCVNGKYQIYAGAWETPGAGYTIAKEDWLSIDSIVTVSPQDKGGRFSEVHCFFVDPNRNWQRVECYVRRNATYLADDASFPASIEMEQPMCTDESEAQRKAEFILRQSRNGIKLVGTLPPRFMFLKTFKTVSVTFSELGWTSKTFRIVAMDTNMDGTVKVALSEEQDTDWTDLASGDYGTPSTASLPSVNPTTPTAPQNLTLKSLAGAIYLDWDAPTVKPLGTRYQVIAGVSSADASVGTVAWEGDADYANVPWTQVSSRTWWWVRAYTGSYYGPYLPTTYGQLGVPAFSPHNARYPIVDPLFNAGQSVRSYWNVTPTGVPASYAYFTNPSSGLGMYDGGIAFYADLQIANSYFPGLQPTRKSVPGDPNASSNKFDVSPGQWLNLALSYRRTTGVSSGAKLELTVSVYRYPPGDIVYALDILNTALRVDSADVNVWQHYVASMQVPTSAAWQKGDTAAIFTSAASGAVYIGQYDITIR